jgi:hypothetical protein
MLGALGLLTACSSSAPASAPAPHFQSSGPVSSASIFFFGHSLVGNDLPAMVCSLAAARGRSCVTHGQLGWGTSLRSHQSWNGKLDKSAPLGFEADNRPPLFIGEGKAQVATGNYDVLVLTESNGHTGGDGKETVASALSLIKRAQQANPALRVFLYANWLDRAEPEFKKSLAQWQAITERDIRWWEDVAQRVNTQLGRPTVRVVPGGPVLAAVTRAIEQGKLPGVSIDDLFRDTVHVSDRGFYVLALLHYAVIFGDSPHGLPTQTRGEKGPAESFSPANAATIQAIVSEYLAHYPWSGL